MITLQTIRNRPLHLLLVVFLTSTSNAQFSNPNNNRRPSNLSRILAGCVVGIIIVMALIWFSQRQRRMRMRRNPRLIPVTIPPNQSWGGGGGPAPYNGYQSPGPSYNPPLGGYNQSYPYPPNYAPPAYGKDAPPGSQSYHPPSGPPPITNQHSYTQVKPPGPPPPAHFTGQDGAGGQWS